MDQLAAAPGPDPASPDRAVISETQPANAVCLADNPELLQGYALLNSGQFDQAAAKFGTTLADLERTGTAKQVDRACLMNAIGFAARQQRRPDLAIEWLERALALNPLPDTLAATLTGNLASAYCDVDRLDHAEELARRAIPLSERAFGPNHPETLFPQVTLAFVFAARGDYARAEPVLRRVLDQSERTWGATSYETALAAGNLAFIHLSTRRYTLARKLFENSLSALRANPIRATDEIPVTEVSLALSFAGIGRTREANLWLEQAMASARQTLDADDPALAEILQRAAITRFLLKDYDSGCQLFDRAIPMLAAHHGTGSPKVVSALDRYAALLRSAKHKTASRKLEELRKSFALKH
jgi:tetratricopeptide (TPR) repeat protein